MNKMISDPNKRLGKNGSEEIKSHPFFKDVDWENIRTKMKPPFVPEIENDYDTKYFEVLDEEEPFYPPKKPIKRRKDMEWLGFTYKGNNDEGLDNVNQNVQQIAETLNIHYEEEKNKNTDNNDGEKVK